MPSKDKNIPSKKSTHTGKVLGATSTRQSVDKPRHSKHELYDDKENLEEELLQGEELRSDYYSDNDSDVDEEIEVPDDNISQEEEKEYYRIKTSRASHAELLRIIENANDKEDFISRLEEFSSRYNDRLFLNMDKRPPSESEIIFSAITNANQLIAYAKELKEAKLPELIKLSKVYLEHDKKDPQHRTEGSSELNDVLYALRRKNAGNLSSSMINTPSKLSPPSRQTPSKGLRNTLKNKTKGNAGLMESKQASNKIYKKPSSSFEASEIGNEDPKSTHQTSNPASKNTSSLRANNSAPPPLNSSIPLTRSMTQSPSSFNKASISVRPEGEVNTEQARYSSREDSNAPITPTRAIKTYEKLNGIINTIVAVFDKQKQKPDPLYWINNTKNDVKVLDSSTRESTIQFSFLTPGSTPNTNIKNDMVLTIDHRSKEHSIAITSLDNPQGVQAKSDSIIAIAHSMRHPIITINGPDISAAAELLAHCKLSSPEGAVFEVGTSLKGQEQALLELAKKNFKLDAEFNFEKSPPKPRPSANP